MKASKCLVNVFILKNFLYLTYKLLDCDFSVFFDLKLNDFREERLELMRLEAEEQTLREEEESNKRSVKESKEKKKRELDKHMVCYFSFLLYSSTSPCRIIA